MRNRTWLWFLLIVTTKATGAMHYFGGSIDYWGDEDLKSADPPGIPRTATFDWEKHLNPENNEFFREGEYLPPSAFMELVRRPTDENIKNWLLLTERKNALSQKLQERMAAFAQHQAPSLVHDPPKVVSALPAMARYRFRLYFHSRCEHCWRMLGSVKELLDLGYAVEVRQVDKGSIPQQLTALPVTRATEDELRTKGISSWPVLFVADLSKGQVYRIQGYQAKDTILAQIGGYK